MTIKKPNHESSSVSCPMALEDIDLFAPGAQEHWYEAYPILHRDAPVRIIRGEGLDDNSDAYILTKYEDICRVVKDPERFTPTMTLGMQAIEERERNGEEHPQDAASINVALSSLRTLRPTMDLWRAHRQELTDPWVGPGAKRHTALINRAADSLIDQWIDHGEVEFISEFARPLPQIVLANVMGFPEKDIPQLATWGSAQVMSYVYGKGHRNILDPDQVKEQLRLLEGFKEYVQSQVAEKRANPQDDMISFLTQVTYKALNRKLADEEINGIVYFMVLGGLETTQYALEEQAQLLCDQPEIFNAIKADRSKVRLFSEEAMRLRAPTQGLSSRITTRDEVFQGVDVPQGSLLHLRWAAGNVDPDEYECPYELRLGRKAVGNHLTFSQGPRTCPGAGISRQEQLCAWNRLLDRLDSLSYAADNNFKHQPGILLGTLELKLQFNKA